MNFVETLEHIRRGERKFSRKASGLATDSSELAFTSVSAGQEVTVLELPVIPLQQSMQDPLTGTPYFVVGYSAVGGGDTVR